MNSETFFFNQAKRLRSGWRFLIFQLLMIAVGAAVGAPVLFVLGRMDESPARILLSYALPGFVMLAAALFCGWLCGRFLEDLPFRALGCSPTKNWLKDFVAGLAAGALAIALAVAVAAVFGGLRLEFNRAADVSGIITTLVVSLLIFFVAAAGEEAYFRGYILQTFSRAHLAWIAIVYTSLQFAVAHFNNQHISEMAKINTVVAGVWFALAYLKTRNLWFPFGIHLAWNWLQGAVLGIPVSGITEITPAPVFLQAAAGDDFLTGGNYGIEGGIACTAAIVLSIVLIYFVPFLKPAEEMLALTGEEQRR
jgi:membrane protease YdiL (CAAX protease family)